MTEVTKRSICPIQIKSNLARKNDGCWSIVWSRRFSSTVLSRISSSGISLSGAAIAARPIAVRSR